MLSTKDIGILIRDRLEDNCVYELDWQADPVQQKVWHNIDFVDVSDANNPVIHLSNGQKFKIVILAI